jgi:hypothetical protein
MGRPRRDSSKSDNLPTAGNVYNASLAAAQLQRTQESESPAATTLNASNTSNTSTLTPQLEGISLVLPENGTRSEKSLAPVVNTVHGRSLSVSELVSLIPSRVSISKTNSSASSSAINSLNIPESLKMTLENADSPILNALLPLIRQKLADKTSIGRRNSTNTTGSSTDSNTSGNINTSTTSLDSQNSRRSSTSSRSDDHRLSHKLAERKRRKEMKDIFDNLKNALPPGVPKSSKWEILNEASITIDELLAQEQALLERRNQLLKQINESTSAKN